MEGAEGTNLAWRDVSPAEKRQNCPSNGCLSFNSSPITCSLPQGAVLLKGKCNCACGCNVSHAAHDAPRAFRGVWGPGRQQPPKRVFNAAVWLKWPNGVSTCRRSPIDWPAPGRPLGCVAGHFSPRRRREEEKKFP
ncbi:uncharacterized protein Tco025E_06089 [Trypanosoma conorhini]|uniref:Uncharacterized protein n=1 Tax=Trypanosoma conorhini TaxID=83891 RepID=A0A422P7J9_9TRYP|nr:uncharacterized protein Tco025E_06089 [Trypanosoma conorhini]RNF13702.1 hypothetical protein Tco025E_06089 [Trypanosoma conorhini]